MGVHMFIRRRKTSGMCGGKYIVGLVDGTAHNKVYSAWPGKLVKSKSYLRSTICA